MTAQNLSFVSSAPSFYAQNQLTVENSLYTHDSMADYISMLGSALPREHTIADQAFAFVPSDDNEHLANLIDARGARASLRFFVSGQVNQQ